MCHCVVSVTGQDGQTHTVETDADSLFAAAYAGIRRWSGLWWFSGDLVIEVRVGEQRWRVKARRVSEWYSERFREGSRL